MLDAASTSAFEPRIAARSASWGRAARPPLLSVVVPVYQTAAYLRASLDSLVPPGEDAVEIIVVHDGGTDGALDIAAAWVEAAPLPALVLDQPNRGLSAARMVGLARASGDCVAFLDSDDIADICVLMRLARDVRDGECDIALCRSAVLDGATLGAQPFYDSMIWDAIMGSCPFRRVTIGQEPRLLRLEPNANPRVLSRAFVERVGLQFPEGLLFEDIPTHVAAICRAGHVGLRNETGYLYRVNRPGKITDERSVRRLDAIVTCRMAVQEALAARVSDAAGAALALSVTRLLLWCGQNITRETRLRFAGLAAELFAAMPESWFEHTCRHQRLDLRDSNVLAAFRHGDPLVIRSLISRRLPPIGAGIRLLLGRNGRPARDYLLFQLVRMARRVSHPLLARLRRPGR